MNLHEYPAHMAGYSDFVFHKQNIYQNYTMKLNNRSIDYKMIEVSKFYEKGYTQEAIASLLGIKQPQVSRLLNDARNLGIIIEIVQIPLESEYSISSIYGALQLV